MPASDGCRLRNLQLVLVSLVCLVFWYAIPGTPLNGDQPNILIILADDLGFSDIGCYGGEIETPHLDRLAAGGLRFTNFYNTGRCWPTRASLLTGYYAHQVRRDKLPGVEPSGMPGTRPDWAPLLPQRLRPAGYRSYHTGKWHLDGMPIQAGFDRSYFLGDQARFFSPQRIFQDDVPQPAVARGSGYYATTDLATQAIRTLSGHARRFPDQPFFHYIALTAPHFPLHALPVDIEKYRDRYVAGWETVRQQRWSRIRQMGIIDGTLSEVEYETGAPYERPDDIETFGPGEVAKPRPWNSLTERQQRFQATKMALHAAMVDRIDQELGRIFQQLRDMGQFENTLILFLSDNGSSSELMIRDDGHDPRAAAGSADTHLCLGPGWSTVGNTPFRKHKTWVHEGGIATPLIAHWPAGIPARGEWRNAATHLIDVVPTILELADGGSKPLTGAADYPGISLLPVFAEDHPVTRDCLWWSHEGHRAIRIGNWKAVKTARSQWQLYDLATDRTETTDLAAANPGKLAELTKKWGEVQTQFVRDATR